MNREHRLHTLDLTYVGHGLHEDAHTSLDLACVHEVVERWRGIAILQTDPTADRRTVRLAAELATGTPSPDDEPLEITTSNAGL